MSSLGTTFVPLRSVSGYLSPHRGLFRRVVLASWALMLTGMATSVMSVHAASTLLDRSGSVLPLILLTLLVVAVGALAWTDSWLSHVLAYRVIDTMRLAVHASLARLAPLGLGRRRSGETAAAAMSDAEQLEWFFAHTIAQVVAGAAAALTATVAAIAWLGAPGLIVPVGQLALLAVPLLGLPVARRQGTALRSQIADLSATSVEIRQSARELVLLDRLEHARNALGQATRGVQSVRQSIAVRTGVEQAAIEIVAAWTTLTMLVVLGSRVDQGSVPASQLPVAVVLAAVALAPVLAIVASAQRVAEMSAAAARIRELVEAPAPRPLPGGGPSTLPARPSGALTVSGVRVTYPGTDAVVLDEVSLELAAGEHVAIVGASGTGKTTLVHTLVRLFEPDSGTIRLGGAEISPEHTRERVSLVDQHPHIFRSSVRDNLLIARDDADDNLLWEVLDDVGLAEHVRSLPEGLGTVLAEHGRTWSGGQRQRLGLARGILRDPDILILDEPTANLDQRAEQAFMERAMTLRAGRTTIVVSHRASTIAHCSRVLLLAAGRIVADGSHLRLMADPRYRAVLATAPKVHLPAEERG
jgi:ATP-binding cassette, subfamily C, bacterial CydC